MTYEKLSNISILCRQRQENNKDVMLVCTGEKGDGKSNYTQQQARDYVERFGLICNNCRHQYIVQDDVLVSDGAGNARVKKYVFEACPKCKSIDVKQITRFDFNYWLAYDASELEDKIYDLPKYSPVISDELARFALTENWNSTESKSMKRLLIQCRTKRLLIMGNIPDFVTLDRKYRNMTNYWVRILQRDNSSALAIFLKRSKGEYEDKFHMKELQELLGDYFEDTPMNRVEHIAQKLVQKHPCVEDFFYIPPLPKDLYDAYEIYRDAKVYDRNQEEIALDQRQMGKVLVYNLMANWEELLTAVKEGRYKRPALKMIEKFLTRNPRNGESLARYTTIRNWINDIEAITRVGKKSLTEEEKIEVEEKK